MQTRVSWQGNLGKKEEEITAAAIETGKKSMWFSNCCFCFIVILK